MVPRVGMLLGPGQGCNRTAMRVQTPNDPAVPIFPRNVPRMLGPGPSPQNHPEPAPSEPVRSTSPLGNTHSAPRMFSLAQPIEMEVGPKPTHPAELATTELLHPTPGIFSVKPCFMASA